MLVSSLGAGEIQMRCYLAESAEGSADDALAESVVLAEVGVSRFQCDTVPAAVLSLLRTLSVAKLLCWPGLLDLLLLLYLRLQHLLCLARMLFCVKLLNLLRFLSLLRQLCWVTLVSTLCLLRLLGLLPVGFLALLLGLLGCSFSLSLLLK